MALHVVDSLFDGADLFEAEVGDIGALGDEAADEAVVVFIGTTLESTERVGVVERAARVFGLKGRSSMD